jgi:hypothetical protein
MENDDSPLRASLFSVQKPNEIAEGWQIDDIIM